MTLNRQIAYIKEEIKRKQQMFPKMVKKGRIDEDKAIAEIATLQKIGQTLTQLRGILST
jgi:hypothetical protein